MPFDVFISLINSIGYALACGVLLPAPEATNKGGSTMNSTDTTAIIIGAGITGIGAAYYLRDAGIPYIVLEANSDLGGVWHTQRWHGARCDTDFIKYSYSFKPHLSPNCLQDRAEIQRYLRSVAEEFAIVDHIRFDTPVTAASFDSRTQRWVVRTNQGTF